MTAAAVTPAPSVEYFQLMQRGDFAKAAEVLSLAPRQPEPGNEVIPMPAAARSEPPVPTGPADLRERGIIPTLFGGVRRMDMADLTLFDVGTSRAPFESRLLGTLPAAQEFPRHKPWHGVPDIMVPAVLVHNAAADDAMVAPSGLRLFLELLMLVPRQYRKGPFRLPPLRVADLAGWLWPNTHYQPERHGPKLSRALILAHNCRLPIHDELGSGYWAPVVVKRAPDTRDPESSMIVDVEMPPGSHAGPMVYRPTLRRYGAKSALAWRLTLALAWLWDRYLTGPRAPGPEHLPWLDNDGLVRLATGRDVRRLRKKQRKHNLLLRSERAIELLHDDGNVEVDVRLGAELVRLRPGGNTIGGRRAGCEQCG